MGRSSGSVQLANEEYIYCGLMKQSNRVLCNMPESKIPPLSISVSGRGKCDRQQEIF